MPQAAAVAASRAWLDPMKPLTCLRPQARQPRPPLRSAGGLNHRNPGGLNHRNQV